MGEAAILYCRKMFRYGGHGGKSVFLFDKFIRLKMDEAIAIFNHMGRSEINQTNYWRFL